MNEIDWVILAILAISVLIGLWRGLVSEVLALAIWVAAFWVAWMFGPVVAAHLEGHIALPSVRIVVGYGLCFVLVMIVGALVRFLVGRLLWSTGLTGIDRLLGMVFGFVRGVLLVCLIVFLTGFTAFTREPMWRQSTLLPQFQQVAAWLEQQVPPDIASHLHPGAVLDKLHELPAGIKQAMPTLPSGWHGAISGTTAAPATSAPVPPAPRGTTNPPAASSRGIH